MTSAVIIEIFASLDAVRTALVALGATSPSRRSVAFELGEHLLLLGTDESEGSTVVAVGGDRPHELADWLAHEFTDVLPYRVRPVPHDRRDGPHEDAGVEV